MKSRYLFSAAASTLLAALVGPPAALAQVIEWDSGGGDTAAFWYTDTNWNPDTASGDWLTTHIAQFNNTGSAGAAGIDMATASLSIGAIEVTSDRTRTLVVLDSSTTGGTLTLSGATVNGVANTVLRNASNSTLTLNNGSGTMDLVLPTAGNNKIVLDAEGAGFRIDSNISGAGGIEMIRNAGISRLDLGGNNTYEGDTVLASGRMRVRPSAGGNVIPNGPGKGNVVFSGSDPTTQFGLQEPETINGLVGGAGSGHVGNDDSNSINTLTVGDNDATASFGGLIINESSGENGIIRLVKIGGGVQTLSGDNTYSGSTTINGGTLLVNGMHVGMHAHANNAGRTDPYTVNNGGTLGGTGSTAALVTINGGGTISPGTSVGTLKVGGLSLRDMSNSSFELNPTDTTPGSGVNDLIDIQGLLSGTDVSGDFNMDGFVDAADYVVWRKDLGDNTNYNAWRSRFGELAATTSNINVQAVGGGNLAATGMWTLALYDSLAGMGLPAFNVTGVDGALDYSVDIVPDDLGLPLGPGLVRLSIFNPSEGAAITDFATQNSVPEPGSVLLLVLGATIAGWRARRQKAMQGTGRTAP